MLASRAVTVAAPPSPLARAWTARWPIGAELVLFFLLMATYEWLRDLVATEDFDRALGHAHDVVDLERSLGAFWEPDIHHWVQGIGPLEFTTTWTYTLAHTTGFAIMFFWVWFRRRESFAMFRNWFWITNALAVVGYWLFPLAPPRLSGLGLADPTKESLELGGSLSWFQPFRNEFAAMPSMHVGYTFLFALTIFWLNRGSRWRWLAFLWPAAMLFVVVSTANHWWLDGVGGVTTVLLGLFVAWRLSGGLPMPWDWRPRRA